MEGKKLKISEKGRLCKEHFEKVAEILTADGLFEVVDSPYSNDRYLIPAGTANQITFYGKPVGSLRLSDHWNWYASIDQCNKPWYLQCYNFDVPRAKKRTVYGASTEPRFAWQCAIHCADGKYRAAYGDIFDRHTKEWIWLDNRTTTPENTAEVMRNIAKSWYKEKAI